MIRKKQSNQTVLFLKINTILTTRYAVHGHFTSSIAKRTRLRERKTRKPASQRYNDLLLWDIAFNCPALKSLDFC